MALDPFHEYISWDGRFRDGNRAPDGEYLATVKALDRAGHETQKSEVIVHQERIQMQSANRKQTDAGFIADTIRRIAQKKLRLSLAFLALVIIAGSCFLGLLWLIGLREVPLFLSVIVVGLIVVGLLIRNAVMLYWAIQNPHESFFLSGLVRFGPLQETIEQIDKEASPNVGKMGSFVTPHWIVSAQSGSLTFMRIEDVVWIYKGVSKSSITIFFATIPTGTAYAAHVWDRFGHWLTILSAEKGVDALLDAIAGHAPWVVRGYLESIAEAWRSHRLEFIAEIDQRRRLMSPSAESSDAGGDIGKHGQSRSNSEARTQLLRGSEKEAPALGLTTAVMQDVMGKLEKKRDRSMRAIGCAALLLGLMLSAYFVLPIIDGVSVPSVGVLLATVALLSGGYYTAFGWKGRVFLERVIFRNWWTFFLFFLVICAGTVLCMYSLEFMQAGPADEVIREYSYSPTLSAVSSARPPG